MNVELFARAASFDRNQATFVSPRPTNANSSPQESPRFPSPSSGFYRLKGQPEAVQ